MHRMRNLVSEVRCVASVSFISVARFAEQRSESRAARVRVTGLIAGALVVVSVMLLVMLLSRPSVDELVTQGFIALAEKRTAEARQFAQAARERDPSLADAYRLAVEVAVAEEDFEQAVQWQAAFIERASADQRAVAHWKAADWLLLKLHRPADAEPHFQAAVELTAAKREFASLLGMCGRVFEANQLRVQCLQAGDIRDVDLVLLGLGETASENRDLLLQMKKTSPRDPLVRLGLAYAAYQSHELSNAEQLLRELLADHRELHAARALLGLVLLGATQDPHAPSLSQWMSDINDAALTHPGVWFVSGEIAERAGQSTAACRCFWETIKRDPAHQRAHYRLGQLLPGIGRADAGRAFAGRASDLQQLLLDAKAFNLRHDLESLQQVIANCMKCGHLWEARGWAAVGQTLGRKPLALQIDSSSGRVAASHDLSQQWRLDDLPLPNFKPSITESKSPVMLAANQSGSAIRFVDDALSAGLDFRFVSGDDRQQPGMRTFEFTGGGIGVLDVDHDGWPDLWLTQGGQWPLEAPGHRSLDRIYRNDGAGRFADMTAVAGVVEDRYSQGIAIGDVDQDGFPDAYVANLGGDRLFLNQGDGTFRDATASAGLADDDWSTSCVFADLSGDSLPDCYVVNYLRGADLATRVCRNTDGRIRSCTPHEFAAAPDRLLLNAGDGTFKEIATKAGIDDANGKGLGVVVLDADGSGRLSVFVANDTTGNFLWSPTDDSTSSAPRFADRALLAGVSFDRDGRSQACMGVAAGDANNDGLIDLLVSNYYDESNTLFRQVTRGLFEDVTAKIGLREPSLKQLGFGTQFIDADRDSWLDLVVLNGHVDDETYRNVPFQMRPQFFRNNGAGGFIEVPAERCGDWFTRPTLGRALVRCDWNRDGRDDFVAGHRDESLGLLTNRTSPLGANVSLRLIGTRSERGAVGATIRVRCGDREFVRQLTAGDGYQCSNDRRLLISVGSVESIESLTIRWPSGEAQTWRGVMSNRDYIAVEGGSLSEIPAPDQAALPIAP